MKKSRFKEEQIIRILEEGKSGFDVDELCRKHGVYRGTYYSWKSKYEGLQVTEAQRLRFFEIENSKLKRLVAEQTIEGLQLLYIL